MKTTIIACSLSPNSKSQKLALRFKDLLAEKKINCQYFDLRESPLPMAGPYEGWEDKNVLAIKKAIEESTHVVFAVPIYCYDVSASTKNVIELAGKSFTNKIISFICSAGGDSSYMSVMGFANHLMLDFRSVIVPRFLYTQKSDWGENGEISEEITQRMNQLYEDMNQISLSFS